MIRLIQYGMKRSRLTFRKQIFHMQLLRYGVSLLFYSNNHLIFPIFHQVIFLIKQIYVVTSKSEANAIGSCGIGPGEQGQGRQHWQDMTHNTRKPTALWHWLR